MGGRIVVGVDGSPQSRRALQFAIDEARRRSARLDVVHVWSMPAVAAVPGTVGPVEMVPFDDMKADAQQLVDELAGLVPSDVPVEAVSVRGTTAGRLLDVARGADLLIVGSRGRGGFRGLLLGSTSHQVITHAPCPVVVVPTPVGDGDG